VRGGGAWVGVVTDPNEKENGMAKTKLDIRTDARKPLYASVGVVDQAAELVRGSVSDIQKRIAEVRAGIRGLDYDQLATRGEVLVARIRRQESTKQAAREAEVTAAKAKTTRTQAKKAGSATAGTAKRAARTTASTASRQAARPKSSAKATGTAARKSAKAGSKATAQAAGKVGD
jgi:heparin binding hemagglutinin HbhA